MFNTGKALAQFGSDLRRTIPLERAIETGTYKGDTARALGGAFPEVYTIELSEELAKVARQSLTACLNVQVLRGDSSEVLKSLSDECIPTFYFLDGHWSGPQTAGEASECPVLAELDAIRSGHDDDCVVIDDARLFAASPGPPHRAQDWPTLLELIDALRDAFPHHHVTMVADQVISVPGQAKEVVDAYGRRQESLTAQARRVAGRAFHAARFRVEARRRQSSVAG